MMIDRILGALPKYPEGHFCGGPSFHKYYDKSFALSPANIRSIVQSISEGIKLEFPESPQQFEVRASTADGPLTFHNLDELLGHDNRGRNRLKTVSITVRPENHGMAAAVEFQDHVPGWTTAVVVEGGDENTSRGLFENIKDKVRPCFQWYSFMLSGRFWSSLLVACVLVYVITLLGPSFLNWKYPELRETRPLVTAQTDVDPTSTAPVAGGGDTQTRNFIVIAVLCVIGVLLGFELIPRLFPKGAFLIGDGAARYKRVVAWRYALVVVLLIPLVVSIARSVQ